jgi:hypothetical protein
MHALPVLDESHDEIALLEGLSADSVAMIAAESLLIVLRARVSKVACLVDDVDLFWQARSLFASV